MALLNPESNQITKLFADTPTAKRAKTNTVDLDRVLDIEAERVTTRELSGRLYVNCKIVQSCAARMGISLLAVAGYGRQTADTRIHELEGSLRSHPQ